MGYVFGDVVLVSRAITLCICIWNATSVNCFSCHTPRYSYRFLHLEQIPVICFWWLTLKYKINPFLIYFRLCALRDSRHNIMLFDLKRAFGTSMILLIRPRTLSVAAFNKQVTKNRSSELCSAMFLLNVVPLLVTSQVPFPNKHLHLFFYSILLFTYLLASGAVVLKFYWSFPRVLNFYRSLCSVPKPLISTF